MATYYVDGTSGLDSNPGTFGSPTKTINAALVIQGTASTGVKNIIQVRKGTYTDAWNNNATYFFNNGFGIDIRAYNGEDVIIDCAGRPNVHTGVLPQTGSIYLFGLYGLKIINYTGIAFDWSLIPQNLNTPLELHSCFFKPALLAGTGVIRIQNYGIRLAISLIKCTFIGHEAVLHAVDGTGSVSNNPIGLTAVQECLFFGNTYNLKDVTANALGTPGTGGEILEYAGFPYTLSYNAYPGATAATNISTGSTPPAFKNTGIGDYSLSATSGLRGAGSLGGHIGAAFNPKIFVDGNRAINLLSAGINDVLWYDPGVPGPGTEGPSLAGPAIFSGGAWQIDTGTVPTATSARVKFGPYTVSSGTVLTVPDWEANEDTTPSPGSKKVIDFIVGTPRTIQISVDGAAKVQVSKGASIALTANTSVAFYVTLRSDAN